MTSDHMNCFMDNIEKHEDNKLCDLVKIRLTEHSRSFSKIDINELHWELMHHNIDRMHVIIKLLKIRENGTQSLKSGTQSLN